MKTPMQQLLHLLEESGKVTFPKALKDGWIEREKKAIVNAAKYGNGRAPVEDKEAFGKNYYLKTFNQ